jgi:hypothetical protein
MMMPSFWLPDECLHPPSPAIINRIIVKIAVFFPIADNLLVLKYLLYCDLPTALSSVCIQRDGGLAQRRLPQNVMRGTAFQFRTAIPAGLMPPLRQTARYLGGVINELNKLFPYVPVL